MFLIFLYFPATKHKEVYKEQVSSLIPRHRRQNIFSYKVHKL